MFNIYSILLDSIRKNGTVLFKDKYVSSVMALVDAVPVIIDDLFNYNKIKIVQDEMISRYMSRYALDKYVLVIKERNVLFSYHIVVKHFNEETIASSDKNLPVSDKTMYKESFHFVKSSLLEEIQTNSKLASLLS